MVKLMRVLLLTSLMCLGACGGPTETALIGSVKIEGDRRFVGQVSRALALLEAEQPDEFQFVESYVGRIRQEERSAMWAYYDPPTIDLSKTSAHYSVTWCAGILVHEAYHSMLYHSYKSRTGQAVPQDVWTSTESERSAIARQLEVLIALNAPKREVIHLSRSDGMHNDVDKDGTYTWSDYMAKDW